MLSFLARRADSSSLRNWFGRFSIERVTRRCSLSSPGEVLAQSPRQIKSIFQLVELVEGRVAAPDRGVKGRLLRKTQACGRDQRPPGFVEWPDSRASSDQSTDLYLQVFTNRRCDQL